MELLECFCSNERALAYTCEGSCRSWRLVKKDALASETSRAVNGRPAIFPHLTSPGDFVGKEEVSQILRAQTCYQPHGMGA